jgi:hypothetical protein
VSVYGLGNPSQLGSYLPSSCYLWELSLVCQETVGKRLKLCLWAVSLRLHGTVDYVFCVVQRLPLKAENPNWCMNKEANQKGANEVD